MSLRLALARSWRPKSWHDVVGQPLVVQALTNAFDQNFLHHAYLFTGTRGVGKTTIARILAKCFNCEQGPTSKPCGTCTHCRSMDAGSFPDLFEIDAASRTKVEDTREILDNVPYAPTLGRFKVYLIDEVHMLSGHSFNALLKTLEEPPAHVKFILATTEPQKLPATVLSRCLSFHLSPLSIQEINDRLHYILGAEGIAFEPEAIRLISKSAKGSLRDALSLLDQAIALGGGTVLTAVTQHWLGCVDETVVVDLLNALASENSNRLLEITAELGKKGVNFAHVLSELLSTLHQITLLQASPRNVTSLLAAIADQITKEDVQLYYQIALMGSRDLPFAPTLQAGFEMIVLRMLTFTPRTHVNVPVASAAKEIKQEIKKEISEHKNTASAWPDIFKALFLTGTGRLLAEQCSLIKMTQDHIELALNPSYKPLMQNVAVARLKEALHEYFQKPMQLTITLQKMGEVPADIQHRENVRLHEESEAALYSDKTVQDIIKTFDAKVIKKTVKPI